MRGREAGHCLGQPSGPVELAQYTGADRLSYEHTFEVGQEVK